MEFFFFVIFFKDCEEGFDRYQELNVELPGRKLVVGHVFTEPECPKLLYVMVGDGIRITGTAVVTIVFCSPWFHVSSITRNVAKWKDNSLCFPGHCCRLCFSVSLKNHERNF